LLSIIKNLHQILDKTQKKILYINIFLLCFTNIYDFFILLYILDIFQFLAGFQDLKTISVLEKIFNIDRNIKILFYFLCFVFIIKFLLTIFVNYLRLKFQKNLGVYISNTLLNRYLYDNILNLRNKKNSELTRNIEITTGLVSNGALQHIFTISSEIVLITLIFTLLAIVNFEIIAFSFIIISIISILFYYFFRKKIEKVGQFFHHTAEEKLQLATETINGSLEIRAFHAQEFFLKKYYSSSVKFFNSNFILLFIQQIPRYLIEIVIVLIISASILLYNDNFIDSSELMKTLGIFGLSSFRLIPSVTKIIHALQGLKYTQPAVAEIAKEVNDSNIYLANLADYKKDTKFINKNMFKEIIFKDVSFCYPDRDNKIFEKINIKIKKNSINLIIGKSGSGKTTFLNLLLGFIKPDIGEIYINDQEDKKQYINSLNQSNLMGYVPQKSYLINDTIKNNITFGSDQNNVSDESVLEAISFSGLEEFVRNLKNGIHTNVRDFASNLSGGQAQRINMARCKFKGSEVLIFDEPFSSLDGENEKNILSNIKKYSLNKTLIIISHRKIETIKFDNIFEINDKKMTTKVK
jgi:ATP-binding cassette subfamily C protein